MKAKIKIMKTRAEVTDEEIKGFMNFESLLKQKQKFAHDRKSICHTRNLFMGFAGFVLITAIIYIMIRNDKQQHHQPAVTAVPLSSQSPKIMVDSLETEVPFKRDTEAPGQTKENEQSAPKTIQTEKTVVNEMPEELIEPVYVQPEPLNGYPQLYAYFARHLVYPPDALKDSVEGIVNVVFSINTTGKAQNITIENSLGLLFDKEAIRLVENMPLWKPASYNGKVVASKISLPITFQLKRISDN